MTLGRRNWLSVLKRVTESQCPLLVTHKVAYLMVKWGQKEASSSLWV